MTQRSVLLSSNYDAWPEAFNSQAYAFLNAVKSIEDADLLCPPPKPYTSGRGVKPGFPYLYGELIDRSLSQLRRKIGKPGLAGSSPVSVDRDYDLFVYTCQFPLELGALENIKGWRERSTLAVCYLLESWPHRFHLTASELKLLDQFDHVFVLNQDAIPALKQYTSKPISLLATACDTLLSSPYPGNPDRGIDVLSIGRRKPAIHAKLTELAARDNSFFYVHDTLRAATVANWAEHRALSANMIKRSKYFICWDFVVEDTGIDRGVKKLALATRYFEGAAGGAILLGSAQKAPEFKDYFDWEDVVIELPEDVADIGAFLADLDRQKDRLDHVRTTNVVQALRRHDWGHRWGQILDTIGLERGPGLECRLDQLSSLADEVERHGAGARTRVVPA